MSNSHLIKVEGNKLGKDYIGTDPHGSLNILKKVVELLEDQDRLFLCGDLVDRGRYSLETLRYLDEEKHKGKNIYLIRGNHEDLVLKSLDLLSVMDTFQAITSGSEFSQDIFAKHTDFPWLNEMALSQIQDVMYWFNYIRHEDWYINTIKKIIEIFPTSNEDGIVWSGNVINGLTNFFKGMIRHIQNGGRWVFDLTREQQIWVRNFIEPLPYMIRVEEVERDDKTIASFDLVHAAPLSEEDIQAVLSSEEKMMSNKQINYITWARPQGRGYPGDELMHFADRSSDSIRTYVGHNIFGANLLSDKNVNIFVLDASTAETQSMLIANHTDNTISNIQLDNASEKMGRKNSEDLGQAFNALIDLADKSPTHIGVSSQKCTDSSDHTTKDSAYECDDSASVITRCSSSLYSSDKNDKHDYARLLETMRLK